MQRRALIIYCDDTDSGELPGPAFDNENFREFLQSPLGGNWYEDEIFSLENPDSAMVAKVMKHFMNPSDYTFIIFSGHGFINVDDNYRQYIELSNTSIAIASLKTSARRQTLIVDACRGYWSVTEELLKGLSESYRQFTGDIYSTRSIFDRSVLQAEEGWTRLYAASENQTALDTNKGAAYLLSLLQVALLWEGKNRTHNVLDLKKAHGYATTYLHDNFDTTQDPKMNAEKRMRHFPFAVKSALIRG